MNGIMNKNQLNVVKDYEYIKSLIQKIDSIIDSFCRDCHKIFFIHLKIDVYIILILQVLEIMK